MAAEGLPNIGKEGAGTARKMSENAVNSRGAGRPQLEAPRPFGAYLDALHRHGACLEFDRKTLFTEMQARSPGVVPAFETFKKVLAGSVTWRPGFDVVFAEVTRLRDFGGGPAELQLGASEFDAFLSRARPAGLMRLLRGGADGTQLRLSPSLAAGELRLVKTGRLRLPAETIDADVPYEIGIIRPKGAIGVRGPVLLVGYGYDDRRWQFISAFTDPPIAPTQSVEWGSSTRREIEFEYATGRFALFAIGSKLPFRHTLGPIYERHREEESDGFLSEHDLEALASVVEHALQDGWVAALDYVMRA